MGDSNAAGPSGRLSVRVRKSARAEWDEGADDAPPPCPLESLPVPMEDKKAYPLLQRACRDGADQRNSWTLEQLECLWAELDMLLAEVADQRAAIHGERALLTVWMAIATLKNPHADQVAGDEDLAGARTRSGSAGDGLLTLTRQMSANTKVTRDKYGRFLRTNELDSPRGSALDLAAMGRAAEQGALPANGPVGGTAAPAPKKVNGAEPSLFELEGEAAGYEIRRVSAEADPEALWAFASSFFERLDTGAAELLDTDARARRFCAMGDGDAADLDDPFQIRPRGRHYSVQWEEEAQLLAVADGLIPSAAAFAPRAEAAGQSCADGAGGAAGSAAKYHWQRDAQELSFTPRVLGALVDQSGFVPRIDMAPTRAGAVDSISQPEPLGPITVGDESVAVESSVRLEQELRAELVRVGLLDSADAALVDEDDALCAEIRQAQAQLRTVLEQNEQLCEASRKRLPGWLAEQAAEEARVRDADEATERWRVIMKRLKAERKAERKRRKLGSRVSARVAAGAGPAAAATPAETAAEPGDGGPEAAPVAEGDAAAVAEGAAPAGAEEPAGEGGSNDDSSEDDREEEPGPGWGAAAPDSIAASEAAAARATAARKRTSPRAKPVAGIAASAQEQPA